MVDPTELIADEDASGDGEAIEEAPVPDSRADITVDELFEILSKPGNRYVLTKVLLSEEAVDYNDLVEYVVEATDRPESMTSGEYRGRILHTLFDSTLPRLDETGLVDYDERSKLVRETETTKMALPYLRMALQQQRLIEQ